MDLSVSRQPALKRRSLLVRALWLADVEIVLKRLVAHGMACHPGSARRKICNTYATRPQLKNVTFGEFCTTVRKVEKL
ncbi:hypothetical protein [Burkholderia ubonensis]|uniref:hypothetical protein n=1 Tax=Burkholderia ubonensis TaxID=101571 RepID=UPI000AC1F27D|nr:hypothetical protein [Burkholderia ubonensis]